MKYISIDGDDIGRKITSCYLRNKTDDLMRLSSSLKIAMENMANYLKEQGFTILFCAADGIAATTEVDQDFDKIFQKITYLAPPQITCSAGVGKTLREAYIALLSAKSNGKNRIHYYHNIGFDQD